MRSHRKVHVSLETLKEIPVIRYSFIDDFILMSMLFTLIEVIV